jgi:glutathione S-transferase
LPDRAAIEAVLPELRDVLAMLDSRLKGRDFLASNRFTFADALLLATLTPARRFTEAATLIAESGEFLRHLDLHAKRLSFVETAPNWRWSITRLFPSRLRWLMG